MCSTPCRCGGATSTTTTPWRGRRIWPSPPATRRTSGAVDHGRIVRAQQASGRGAEGTLTGCRCAAASPGAIASIPIPSWAKKVFPDLPADQAHGAAVGRHLPPRSASPAAAGLRGPVAASTSPRWRAGWRSSTKLNFKSLRYTNSLGTDLTVELPEGHIWEAGNDVDPRRPDLYRQHPHGGGVHLPPEDRRQRRGCAPPCP